MLSQGPFLHYAILKWNNHGGDTHQAFKTAFCLISMGLQPFVNENFAAYKL